MSEVPALRTDVHPIFQLRSARPDRLIHLRPDELARSVPEHPLFSYPRSPNPQDGFIDVSSQRFANGIHRASWYLLSVLGPPKGFDTVCYMGPNDIRYFLLMFAAIRVGYKMLFLSPRNNLDGHLNVLEGADCHIFLRAKETKAENILRRREMRTAVVPELEEFLDDMLVDIYPYTKNFAEARMDPCLVLHTTGSTGLPKPIVWKLGLLSTYEAWRTIPPVNDYVPTTIVYQQSRRAYTSMPLFHTSGINAGITWALLLGVTLVYGSPQKLPNAHYTDEMHKYANVDASMGAPSIYEDLSRNKDSLEGLKRLEYVVASGEAGDIISKYTRVIGNLGATETACLQRLAPSIRDWQYFYWHPTHSGIEMRETTEGLYELFLVRDPKLELLQGIFYTFPDIQEWSMQDLYDRHPEKPFLFRYKGRKDDVIVLSNGEKVAPALMETTLSSNPIVKGAMVFGRGRFQPAALIDLAETPSNDVHKRREIIQKLLPTISEANKHAPAHGKLDQYHILFADDERPIYYLGQGKIQRRRTYDLYEKDIDILYRAADDANDEFGSGDLPALNFETQDSVQNWVKELIARIADVQDIDTKRDLFESGVDSLHVIQMARALKYQAKKAGLECAEKFTTNVIYENPSVGEITQYISQQVHSRESSQANNMDSDESSQDFSINKMRSILDKYASDLPRAAREPMPPSPDQMTVILSGSTGSLGSYLLETLYHNANVSRIICLNRNFDAADKHHRIGPTRGLTGRFDPKRVEFHQADLSQTHLGLDVETYRDLLEKVTHIVHNQWPVNFNWTISSFEPYVHGVRNLIDFSIASTHRSFLLFISSVSAVGKWDHPNKVPETPIHDLSAASMGYGQSKLISECLLDKAAATSGVRSTCCRVGVVAGPVKQTSGRWNPHEYIPSVIISSAHLGVLPATFPSRDRIDWLPVDKLSEIIIEILRHSCTEPESSRRSQMYHVVNPNTVSWSTVVPWIVDAYPDEVSVDVVPFQEWLDTLAEKSADISIEHNPAAKLLSFYQGVSADGERSSKIQPREEGPVQSVLANVGPVNPDWVENWVKQWHLTT